jgi:hypothetical protein
MLSLRDLLRVGLISEGDQLIWLKSGSVDSRRATILTDGKIKTEDGKIHSSPSSAAKHVNSGISTNGWRVWVVSANGKSLAEIRSLYPGRRADHA